MAVLGGAESVWNRWDVPWPACNAMDTVPAEHGSVRCLSAVLKRCRDVDSILNSKMLVVEQRLLHSIIYSFHYQMRHQKTYRSLKQVEQCLKRLNLMNLKKSFQEISQMGPLKQKSENSEESFVPSQPVIEVVLVKILGSCKLMLHLLECCCTSFLLVVKHLCLEEFILFNTLVLGLLSRLWILYRAALKNLGSLYKSLFELLQEVSEIHQRPYIKGFVFPSDINVFLGISYSEIKKKMPNAVIERKAGTRWMNRLISVKTITSQSQVLNVAVPTVVRKKKKKKKKKRKGAQNTDDIGEPVLVNRYNEDLASKMEVDLKILCKYPNSAPHENSKLRITSVSSKTLRLQQLNSFVTTFKKVQSFEELSEALKTTILWCKSNKFGSEAFFLGMKLLKSKRLQHVEAQGCRLQKKLGCVKATVSKYLALRTCGQRLKQILNARPHSQQRIKLSQKQRCVSGSIFAQKVCPVSEGTASPSLGQCFQPWTAEPSPKIKNEAAERKDDIDDIFKVIGL